MALYKLTHSTTDGYTYTNESVMIIETANLNKIKPYIKQKYPLLIRELTNGYSDSGSYESVTFKPLNVDVQL